MGEVSRWSVIMDFESRMGERGMEKRLILSGGGCG
jgi:hypothetical protein